MPSLINTEELDTEFPVPGQDNDSQGFRDNFTSIKTNLDTAGTEISALQSDTVKVNADSTFLTTSGGNPTTLNRANLRSFSTFKFPVAQAEENQAGTTLTLSFLDGDYQVYNFTQPNVEFNFNQAGWPGAGRVGKITAEMTSSNPSGTTISFNSSLDVKVDNSWTNPQQTLLIPGTGNPTVIEFWTRTGGTTIFARNLGEFN